MLALQIQHLGVIVGVPVLCDESTGSQNDYGYAETTGVGPEDAGACAPPDVGAQR